MFEVFRQKPQAFLSCVIFSSLHYQSKKSFPPTDSPRSRHHCEEEARLPIAQTNTAQTNTTQTNQWAHIFSQCPLTICNLTCLNCHFSVVYGLFNCIIVERISNQNNINNGL